MKIVSISMSMTLDIMGLFNRHYAFQPFFYTKHRYGGLFTDNTIDQTLSLRR